MKVRRRIITTKVSPFGVLLAVSDGDGVRVIVFKTELKAKRRAERESKQRGGTFVAIQYGDDYAVKKEGS